jgi:flagellar motility protein MotE (MotC chaperone)
MEDKKSKFSREALGGIYRDLRGSIDDLVGGKQDVKGEGDTTQGSDRVKSRELINSRKQGTDKFFSYLLPAIGSFAVLRFSLTFFAFLNYLPNPPAKASQIALANNYSDPNKQFIFTELDKRRAELEKKRDRLESREREVVEQEQELAVNLSELRQLTQKLRDDRTKKGIERDAQLEQLANVYVSMKPEEAARLLGQLDNMIALDLIKKMPEKRIGQLLSLMEPERALLMTKMLTGGRQ